MAAPNSVEYSYTSRMGIAVIATANSSLSGSGTLGTIITGASSGTFIKSLIIKAQTNTDEGMVRIFVKKSGGNNMLLSEIYIPPVRKSGRDLSYYTTIPLNYTLASGDDLKAATQNANTFNVIAEGFDISYITSPAYIGNSLEYVANSGTRILETANPNLDGTGTIATVFTARTAASGYSGCAISSIVIKAQQTTLPGMIRLFIQNDSAATPVLFCETIVPAVTQSATTQSFSWEVISQGSLCIPPGYNILASTEQTNIFGILIEAADWKHV